MKKVSNSDVTVIIPTLNEGIVGVSMKEFSKVLVTGGAGFIGFHLVDRLRGMGVLLGLLMTLVVVVWVMLRVG